MHLLVRGATAVACVVAVACSESTSPPKPAAVTANVSTTLNGTVGAAASASPTVKVVDDAGSPIAGVSVTFAVTAGGGSLARTVATTDAAGVASAGTWTLGTAAGVQTVDATHGALASIRFTAIATAGAPATLTVAAGNAQSANVGTAVATAPAVLVSDQYGNPVAGAAVTFIVVSGGGTVSGAPVNAGADGVARAGSWTLGIANGAQQLRASAGALTTTITATATVPAGCAVTNYALGSALTMNWEASDCVNAAQDNRPYDRLRFTTTSQQSVDAVVTGPNGRRLQLRDTARDLYVGLQPGTAFSPVSQNPMHMKYVLAPGTYEFEPIGPDAATFTSYTLSTTTGTRVDCDYIVFGTVGVQFTDSVTANSCAGPGGSREQWVNLQLKTGMKVRITLVSSNFLAGLVFRDDRLGPASPTLASRTQTTVGETLVIDWTATFDTWHEIVVYPRTSAMGTYTLKIEQLP